MKYLSDESLRQKNAKKGFQKVINFNHELYARQLMKIVNYIN